MRFFMMRIMNHDYDFDYDNYGNEHWTAYGIGHRA